MNQRVLTVPSLFTYKSGVLFGLFLDKALITADETMKEKMEEKTF